MVTSNLQLENDGVGYRVTDGYFNTRAIIIPIAPNRFNGRSRWQIDAIGLPYWDSKYARTLAQAKAIAYHYAV
jgi:hypothetical protein